MILSLQGGFVRFLRSNSTNTTGQCDVATGPGQPLDCYLQDTQCGSCYAADTASTYHHKDEKYDVTEGELREDSVEEGEESQEGLKDLQTKRVPISSQASHRNRRYHNSSHSHSYTGRNQTEREVRQCCDSCAAVHTAYRYAGVL